MLLSSFFPFSMTHPRLYTETPKDRLCVQQVSRGMQKQKNRNTVYRRDSFTLVSSARSANQVIKIVNTSQGYLKANKYFMINSSIVYF